MQTRVLLSFLKTVYSIVFLCTILVLLAASTASAGAVRPGFNASSLAANDDGSTGSVPLGFSIDFFGTGYNSLYVNNNGNVTFGNPLDEYTPSPIGGSGIPIISPFWADVDTRGSGSGIVHYGVGTVDGRNAFGVNWVNVGYFGERVDKLNSFQLVLVDRSDRAPGAFDIEFNYDNILWETGDSTSSGGTNGLGGFSARAGYSNGAGNSFELAGSGVNGAFLNSNASTGLINKSKDSTVLGRYLFEFSRVTKVEYEQIDGTDLGIDENPNTGRGGRIFPDKKDAGDTVDRRRIRVKAKYGENKAGARIYFRSFDLDDPSANSAPIDVETTANAGDDNNGNVDGTTNTRAGQLSIPTPNPNNCQPFAAGVSCLTDATGTATVDFITTRQPGDNFTVAASANETYLTGLTLAADGMSLKDTSNVTTPETKPNLNPCESSSVRACRAEMLTVWRRLHLEVDSMGTVSGNQISGSVPSSVKIRTGANDFNITTTEPLDIARFDNGRIDFGVRFAKVVTNSPSAANPPTNPPTQVTYTTTIRINNNYGAYVLPGGQTFTLYDDDDYNADDTLLDGDSAEPIVRLPESFKYLSDDLQGGNYSDGKSKNMYGSAYIIPEYTWAESVRQYNQTNLQFELNVEDGTNNATLINVLNRNRDSRNDEKDDFWIGYILIGYQGPILSDFDGLSPNGTTNENARQGVAPNQFLVASEIPSCDCFMSSNCPSGGRVCSLPNGTPTLPRGALGCLVFQEVNQDLKKYFSLLPLPYTPRTIEDIKLTIPHEIGHQFGLLGDQKRTTFKVMDYSDYIGNVVNDEAFHPEHINIMRRRIKSPGE